MSKQFLCPVTPAEVARLRSFAVTVGSIFGLLGVWPAIVSRLQYRWWAIALSFFLIFAGVVIPRRLVLLYRAWMGIGHILAWVNTRIILGIVFYGIVTPIGVIRRSMGKDPMDRELRPDLETYRVPHRARPHSHLRRQY